VGERIARLAQRSAVSHELDRLQAAKACSDDLNSLLL
jgi:hypothetical protein